MNGAGPEIPQEPVRMTSVMLTGEVHIPDGLVAPGDPSHPLHDTYLRMQQENQAPPDDNQGDV